MLPFYNDWAGKGEYGYNYYSVSEYGIDYLSEKIASINEYFYEYTGGAHGVHEKIYKVYSLSNGERLKIEDILIDVNNLDLINKVKEKLLSIADEESYFNLDGLSLQENNFYITLSKVEDKINNRIKGLEEKEQNRIRENMYKFYRSQIDRVSNNAIELATGISRHLRIANTIFPTYMSEFEERRLEMDRAMACCNALQDELQYAGECLYADLNKYMNLVLQIQKEFNMIKSLRQTDNRFLKNIKK